MNKETGRKTPEFNLAIGRLFGTVGMAVGHMALVTTKYIVDKTGAEMAALHNVFQGYENYASSVAGGLCVGAISAYGVWGLAHRYRPGATVEAVRGVSVVAAGVGALAGAAMMETPDTVMGTADPLDALLIVGSAISSARFVIDRRN